VTTANVEVGGELAVTGNVSDLNVVSNVNMLHTSNTAALKVNSNVVTEFQRSKKLIKYPRVALSTNDESGTSGYVASASDTHYGTEAWKVFPPNSNGVLYWAAGFGLYSTTSGVAGGVYDTTDASAKRLSTTTDFGEWLKLELPHKIILSSVYISARNLHTYKAPGNFKIYGSNNDSDWYTLLTVTGATPSYPNGNYYSGGSDSGTSTRSSDVTPYKYLAIVVSKAAGGSDIGDGSGSPGTIDAMMIAQMEYYGTPEYDPDANGVDVKVTSYPNVPNTDWLEVYYDGQDYSADTDFAGADGVDNKTGVSTYDATPINGVGFDTEYKAFTFDANSSQYLSSSTPVSGNYIHTISMWFKGTNLTSTGGDTLMWVGDNTDNKRIEIYIENDLINYNFRTNNCIADTTFQNNRWYHLTCTYNGTQGSAGREIYVDGQRLSAYHSGNLADLNITNSTLNVGGFSGTSTTYMFSGSIANFRLFNRALTSDEIWQLYAYQKEYFGHGDLGMTLKAGRLGIGTSEPRAALDVRGNLRASGLTIQTVSSTKTDTFSTTGASNHPVSPGNDVPGLAVTIHPKFANSKILVSYTVSTGAYGRAYLRIQRKQGGSTTTIAPSVGPEANTQNQGKCTTSHSGSGDSSVDSQSFEYYDTIGGTEPITYQIQAWTYHSVYYIYVNRGHDDGNGSNNGTYWARTLSSITAKEVCQ
jgi:hypothetical protein